MMHWTGFVVCALALLCERAVSQIEVDYFAFDGVNRKPCQLEWTYVNANGSSVEITQSCVNVSGPLPPIGELYSVVSDDPRLDLTSWCSTVAVYGAENSSEWGYCESIQVMDTSTSPTIESNSTLTASPSLSPTGTPTLSPTALSVAPSTSPTSAPSLAPTFVPSLSPSALSTTPTSSPTSIPSISPSVSPSTMSPTGLPTMEPSMSPTAAPTSAPSSPPTTSPSLLIPTTAPTEETASPTLSPSEPNVEVALLTYEGNDEYNVQGMLYGSIGRTVAIFSGSVDGLDSRCTNCKVGIHEGFSCNTPDSPGFLFWLDEDNGYMEETYSGTNAELKVTFQASSNLEGMYGRTLVLYDDDDERMACGKIVPLTGDTSEIFESLDTGSWARVATVDDYPSDARLQGQVNWNNSVMIWALSYSETTTPETIGALPLSLIVDSNSTSGLMTINSGDCSAVGDVVEGVDPTPWSVESDNSVSGSITAVGDLDDKLVVFTDRNNIVLACGVLLGHLSTRGQFRIDVNEEGSSVIAGSVDGLETTADVSNAIVLLGDSSCMSGVIDESDVQFKFTFPPEIYLPNRAARLIVSIIIPGTEVKFTDSHIAILASNNRIAGCGKFDSLTYEENTFAPTSKPSTMSPTAVNETLSPTMLPSPSPVPNVSPTVPVSLSPTSVETEFPTDSPTGLRFSSSESFVLILVLVNIAVVAAVLCLIFPPKQYWPTFCISGQSAVTESGDKDPAETIIEDPVEKEVELQKQ